ncbi:MAG: twin-arginine translocase subunit TatB [Gammaproteobacteria bacterium]|nr:twin-arginine translocase subunit TatB [Gammaproteobacteria bacterium]
MFDIGFWEIALIGVIALIVIGPEKLPSVARNVGAWVGKGKRLIGSVQADISRELNRAEELKQLLEEQKDIVKNNEIVKELQNTISIDDQLNIKNPETKTKVDTKADTTANTNDNTKAISNTNNQDSTKKDSTKKNLTKKTSTPRNDQ